MAPGRNDGLRIEIGATHIHWTGHEVGLGSVLMKRSLFTTLTVLTFAAISHAGMEIPRSVFKMDELEEAKEKATKSEKPLIFVYTDPGSK